MKTPLKSAQVLASCYFTTCRESLARGEFDVEKLNLDLESCGNDDSGASTPPTSILKKAVRRKTETEPEKRREKAAATE